MLLKLWRTRANDKQNIPLAVEYENKVIKVIRIVKLSTLSSVNYTIDEPIGVSAIITPWNLTIYLLTFKLTPALAFDNTVVAKPSQMTSVTAFLRHILQEVFELTNFYLSQIEINYFSKKAFLMKSFGFRLRQNCRQSLCLTLNYW